jgi:predicted dehydrogenase
MQTSGRKPRVVIISAAWGVAAHLPAWRVLADEVEVIGIMTSREETAVAAARANGIPRAYWDIDTLCADADVDIVDVGTQPRIRQLLCAKVLAAGKHCYAGIPFATDTVWSQRLLDAQRSAGVVGMVDATIMAVPAVVRMKEMIDEGFLGDIWFAHSRFNQQLFNQPPAHWPYKWFADEGAGASGLRNLGSHALHPMVHLLGPVAEAIGSNIRCLDSWHYADGEVAYPANPDSVVAMLRFASGAVSSLATSWVAADGPGWSLEIQGSKGRLLAEGAPFPTAEGTRLYAGPVGTSYVPVGTWQDLPARLTTLPGSLLDPAYPDRAAAEAHRAGPQDLVMGSMFRAMLATMRGEAVAQPDFARAHHVQQVVQAICRSDESRTWEPVAA